MIKQSLLVVSLLASMLAVPAFAQDPSAAVEMTRAEVNAAFNAIVSIGQYKTAVRQGGQDVVVDKFLDVSLAMRSTLLHDMTLLRAVASETSRLNDEARMRLLDDKAYGAEVLAIAEQKVKVEGLIRFTEKDLQLDKNPQITPMWGAALSALMTP